MFSMGLLAVELGHSVRYLFESATNNGKGYCYKWSLVTLFFVLYSILAIVSAIFWIVKLGKGDVYDLDPS